MNATITPAQDAYIAALLDERDLSAEARPAYRVRIAELTTGTARRGLTRTAASALIDTLRALPVVAVAAPSADLIAGRYAVQIDGDLVFAKVDTPTEGRWAGRTFVSRIVSDNEYRMPRSLESRVRAAILADPAAASVRYGAEIGACGVCGRTLTNAESRQTGIGPVCRDRMGW